MALTVLSNFAANVAHRNLVNTDAALSSSLAKLSSGQRIVQAKDDAASLAIGSRLAAEVGALRQAAINTSQAASMLQIADGAMARVNEILVRMKTLAVQSSSGQLSNTERAVLDVEYQALKAEIGRIGADTEFNGVKLIAGSISITGPAGLLDIDGVDAIRAQGLDTAATINLDFMSNANGIGTFTAADTTNGRTYTAVLATLQIGDGSGGGGTQINTPLSITLTSSDAQVIGTITLDLSTAFNAASSTDSAAVTLAGSDTTTLTFKVGTGAVAAEDDVTFSINSVVAIQTSLANTIKTQGTSELASSEVTNAIDTLASARARVGANQSRLDFAAANIATAVENSEAARSQLLDLDVASEMTIFTSKQILMQAGVSVLAQAQQIPANLLRLFQ